MLTEVPAMAWRAVPSVTTRRRAPAEKSGRRAPSTSVAVAASSPTHRPFGILPPAAMAAATRAI